MTKKGDTCLTLSADLVCKIKKIIASSEGSYETMIEFVRDAIREKLERLGDMEKIHMVKSYNPEPQTKTMHMSYGHLDKYERKQNKKAKKLLGC